MRTRSPRRRRRWLAEAAEIQRKLLEIEDRRHAWEREDRGETDEAIPQPAEIHIRFAYRDSARTWARILAINVGPSDATDVQFSLHTESDGAIAPVELVRGTDYGSAEKLQPNESVHVGVAFSMGSPQPEDLRYALSWIDERGPQTRSGRIPIE